MPMSDEMWKALLADVESTLNMVERVGQNELTTGYSMRYEQGKPMPGSLSVFEQYRLGALQLLREVWGDIDEEKYNAVTARLNGLKQDHEARRLEILAMPRHQP